MKLVLPDFEILTPISEGGKNELQLIEKIGRVCYKSENYITKDGESAERFVKMLINRGHEAMIEHSFLSVKFTVDRGVSHELVRHRLASFAQESTRYVNYASNKFNNEISVIDLAGGICIDNKMKTMSDVEKSDVLSTWLFAMETAERAYLKLIELGATPQIARSVLPNSTKTEIVISANYREWRNIFKLRTPHTAHPQMREIIIRLLDYIKTVLPIIFDDIEVVEADDKKDIPSVHYKYEVNIGGSCATGEIIVPENATETDIDLAILDDLYEVSYEKVEANDAGEN